MRAGFAAVVLLLAHASGAVGASAIERVTFASADGRTALVGYIFAPAQAAEEPRPAVVMMHGRSGAYSSRAQGVYDAATLSGRHRSWGRALAQAGYVALLVDGFGPRGHPQGFPRFSHRRRPPEVDETTARPLDAYGALAYLRGRRDVAPERIALFGWSNGASAALAAMAAPPAGAAAAGFAGALAFYPGCGLRGRFVAGYRPYAPVRVFMGAADEEVSPRRCAELVAASRRAGGDIVLHLYPDATHGFDDPGRRRRANPANVAAASDARARALEFLERRLRGRRP